MKHRSRGSIMMFVVVMMTSMTTMLVSSVDLSTAAQTRQSRAERDLQWRYASDGMVALATERLAQTTGAPSDFTYTFTTGTFRAQTTNNLASSGRRSDILVTGNLRGSRRSSVTVGSRSTVSAAWYALYATDRVKSSGSVSCNGDVYSLKNMRVDRTAGTSINANYETSDPAPRPVGLGVTGTSTFETDPPRVATWIASSYRTSADSVITSDYRLSGFYSFPAGSSGARLVYVDGDAEISGVYRGECTIYVTGNVNIPVGLVPQNGSVDHLVIITDGNVTINGAAINAVIFAKGDIDAKVNVPKSFTGSLVARDIDFGDASTSINWDSLFWSFPSQCARFHLPGF